MWNSIISFVQGIFSGSFSLFSQLASNDVLAKAYGWLTTGFVIFSIYRFIIQPITSHGVSSFMGIVNYANDSIRKKDGEE